MTTEQNISALKPGQELRISGDAKCWVTVERSGDGKTLRYVRNTTRGFEVFRTVRFDPRQDSSPAPSRPQGPRACCRPRAVEALGPP